MKWYTNEYNLTIEPNVLLENLSQIISKDFNNYSFRYQYFYYYCIAKYLADNWDEKEIENIMENLYVNENAYITLFMAHHSRNIKILDSIENIAKNLFVEYKVATLTRWSLIFWWRNRNV